MRKYIMEGALIEDGVRFGRLIWGFTAVSEKAAKQFAQRMEQAGYIGDPIIEAQ